MRMLVTGASGSLGSSVAERFAGHGHEVRALVWQGAAGHGESFVADLADRDVVRAATVGIEVAVHCAAAIGSDMEECRRVNIGGTTNLVDGLVANGCRLLIHMSTITVYDDAHNETLFDETSPTWTTPADAYGFTKAEAERIVLAASAPKFAVVVLRPGAILSMRPRSRWGPLALQRARDSQESIMPFPELPYVHVDNLVDAIALTIESPVAWGHAYNVIDGSADTREYLNAVYGAIGRATPPIPPEALRQHFRADRIRQELGWAPVDRWGEFLEQLSAIDSSRATWNP